MLRRRLIVEGKAAGASQCANGRYPDCSHDKLVAFSCKRRDFCPSCGARRMAQTATHLVDPVIPRVSVRQWVLSLPIPPSPGTGSPLD